MSPVVVSCHRAPQAGGRPPENHPWHCPFPSMFLDISVLTGVSLASWLALQWSGHTLQANKPCSCPAWGLKTEPRVGERDITGLLDGDRTGLYRELLEWLLPVCGSRHTDHGGHCCYLVGKEAAAAAKSLQLCPTLCDPIDGSPPGSPVPAILQARALEWVAISFSNA